MKMLAVGILSLLGCAPLANAESFSKAVNRVGRQLNATSAQLANPALRLVAGGQLIAPDDPVPNVSVVNTALVSRTGDSATALVASAQDALTGGVKPLAAYALPVEFVSLTKEPAGVQPRSIQYEPVLLVLNALRFQSNTGRFEASMVVGLRNPSIPQDRSELTDPVKLLLRSDADEVSPAEVSITRLGDPQTIKISSISPATPFKVFAATLLDNGDGVEIPVVRPTLLVEPARGSINGLGLEKTTIHVQADKIANATGLRVSIKTSQGEVSPTAIELDAQGRGSVELRSAGTGATTLAVSGAPFETGKAVVEFGKPWSSLIAAWLGAVAGWVLLMQGRKKKTAWSVIVALASAAFVFAGYSVGIRLAQWAPDATVGEALVFFVAAVGAFMGVKALVPTGR